MTLEFNDYNVITANSAERALEILEESSELPDVILSYIMMPKMDGYEFFQEVSNNILWNDIPFIFLTARSNPQDVRFGKMLGVDDYITKPFKEEDLIATLSGKISRKQKAQLLNLQMRKITKSFKEGLKPSINIDDKSEIFVLMVEWDDVYGPEVKESYPKTEKIPYNLNELGNQLFQGAVSIYGQENIENATHLLLNIENIDRMGLLFFDSYPSTKSRSGQAQYMLSVIAPRISYFDSLRLKEHLSEASKKIKQGEVWDVKSCWEKTFKILTSPSFSS